MLRIKADSVVFMTKEGHKLTLPREQLTHGLALGALLLMAVLALFGPSGLLAWSENNQLLDERTAQIALLTEERDELRKLDSLRTSVDDLIEERFTEELNFGEPMDAAPRRRGRPRKKRY